MIISETELKSVDNSGVRRVKTIRPAAKKRFASIGDIFLGIAKKIILRKKLTRSYRRKVWRGTKVGLLLLRQRQYKKIKNYSRLLKFRNNRCIVVQQRSLYPYATRIKGITSIYILGRRYRRLRYLLRFRLF